MATVLAQQSRAAGTIRSNPIQSSLVPTGTITGRGLLNAAGLQDSALLVTLGIEANDTPNAAANDPGWYILTATDWHGGSPTRDGSFPPPTASYASSVITAAMIRGFMTINKTATIGVDVTVT